MCICVYIHITYIYIYIHIVCTHVCVHIYIYMYTYSACIVYTHFKEHHMCACMCYICMLCYDMICYIAISCNVIRYDIPSFIKSMYITIYYITYICWVSVFELLVDFSEVLLWFMCQRTTLRFPDWDPPEGISFPNGMIWTPRHTCKQ